MRRRIENVISVDVEQWFHRPILRGHVETIDPASSHILEALKKILQILKRYRKRTTFFVLGQVAEYIPEVIEQIVDEGNEVAFHGYSHLTLSELGERRFEEEVKKGIKVIQHLTKERLEGFRAPTFSLNKGTVWALKILEKHGFKYDSSVFPTKTQKYGLWRAPTRLYAPSFQDPGKEDASQVRILEFPILVREKSFIKIPAAGGFYLRLFGANFILESIKNMNKRGYPAMCYVHPWEVYGFPKIDLPIHKSLFAYYRIPCFKAFKSLIKSVNVAPAREILEKYGSRGSP